MGRLINTDEFMENVVRYSRQSLKTIGEALDRTKTVDAVPVRAIAEELAILFGCPCNYGPLDEIMFDYCGDGCDETSKGGDIKCWETVIRKWAGEWKEGEVVSETKEPPLGLMPKFVWDKRREEMILQAVVRYTNAGKCIPIEWISELAETLEIGIDLRDGECGAVD